MTNVGQAGVNILAASPNVLFRRLLPICWVLRLKYSLSSLFRHHYQTPNRTYRSTRNSNLLSIFGIGHLLEESRINIGEQAGIGDLGPSF